MISNAVKTIPFLLLYQTSLAAPQANTFDRTEEQERFKDFCLGYHNLLRAFYGAPPLVWDDELAESSQAWANYLNTIQEMKHSSTKYGENLFAINNPENIDLICEYACKAWFKERHQYDFNNPMWSSKTGHFTQMVWVSSKRIGIGEAGQADGNFYSVAKYYPAGNVEGEFKENVRPFQRIPTSCIPNFADPKKMLNMTKAIGVTNIEEYVYNSSEPCYLHNSTTPQKQTETEKVTEANRETGELTGQPGQPGDTETLPILVAIPIAEPEKVQGPPQAVLLPSVTVIPPTQGAALTSSLVTVPPQSTAFYTSAPPTSVTASSLSLPTSSTAQNGMNPARATNAFDPTPGKRTKMIKELRIFPKP